jgi:acid-sensing ion channel, other
VLAFLFSLSSCSYLIFRTYEKWDRDPVLVTFNERFTPTWKVTFSLTLNQSKEFSFSFQIPFPAVTICPESKTNTDKFNLTEIIEKNDKNETLTLDQEIVLEALAQICDFEKFKPKSLTSARGNYIKKLREVNIDFISNSSAMLINHPMDLQENFQHVFTEDGFCLNSNMLGQQDLYKESMNKYLRTPENNQSSSWNIFGYKDPMEFSPYPMRILGSGVSAGLFLKLAMRKKDVVYSCRETSGFRITFHTPDEMPKPKAHFFKIPFNVETMISIQPKKMSTSDNLKAYTPKKRQCYFRGERRLKYFKHYNLANCKLECLTSHLNIFKSSSLSDKPSIFQTSRWKNADALNTRCQTRTELKSAATMIAPKCKRRFGLFL